MTCQSEKMPYAFSRSKFLVENSRIKFSSLFVAKARQGNMPCRRIVNLTNNHQNPQRSANDLNEDVFAVVSPGLPYNSSNQNRDLCIGLTIARMQVCLFMIG